MIAWMRWLARCASWLFYRIDRVGQAPPSGAAILLPNHFNALLDPALVWATAGRDVRFLAKSTLFEGALAPLVRAARAIPVHRRQDGGTDPARNEQAFSAAVAALAAGEALCIFPEGISHARGRLEPLRTGAARIALTAEMQGVSVALVPVGLNFERQAAFRSRAIVAYGPPFSAGDLVALARGDYPRAMRQLTERMAESMRPVLVEAEPTSDACLVDRVERLYGAARKDSRDPAERLARRQIIAAGLERLRRERPGQYEGMLYELRRYDDRLARLGLADRSLDWRVSPRAVARFALREALLALLLSPLTLGGLLLFYVPYRATGALARRITSNLDLLATVQVFAGAVVYGLWFALAVAVAAALGGRTAAWIAALGLPLFSVLALLAIERQSAVWSTVRDWLQLRRAPLTARARLVRHRSVLAEMLDEVRDWLAATPRAGSANRRG